MLRSSSLLRRAIKQFEYRSFSTNPFHSNPNAAVPLVEHYRPSWPDADFNHPAVHAPTLLPKTVDDEILSFEMSATFQQERIEQYPHLNIQPQDLKVRMRFNYNLLGMTDEEKGIFRRLLGPRCGGDGSVKLSCDMFPSRIENERFLKYQLEVLLQTTRFLAKKIFSADSKVQEDLLKKYTEMNPYKWNANGEPLIETAADFRVLQTNVEANVQSSSKPKQQPKGKDGAKDGKQAKPAGKEAPKKEAPKPAAAPKKEAPKGK